MSEFRTCEVALGKRRYKGEWREVGEWTFVSVGDTWDCARTLRHPPRRVAAMLVKRIVERGVGLPPKCGTIELPAETIFTEAAGSPHLND